MEIPGFKINQLIGQGGMASVYLAIQESLGRPVALKILSNTDAAPSFSQRFIDEGSIIASLNHSNIITIYDIGVVGPHHYISMEYVDGGDLEQRLDKQMPPEIALEIVERIGGCLHFVHQKNIIHRDVKPANILFRQDGTPILTDFGIAKRTKINSNLTAVGTAVGTPDYLSPEQAQELQLDGRADLYSLGVMLYEMLTGSRPYLADSYLNVIMKHVQDPIPTLPATLATYQELINRMLAKDPNDRFANGAQLVQFVRRLRHTGDGSDTGPTVSACNKSVLRAQGTLSKIKSKAPAGPTALHKRATIRHPVDLHVQLNITGLGKRAAKVEDICLGGMFLVEGSLSQHNRPLALANLKRKQQIDIFFRIPNEDEVEYEVHSQIARASGNGIGISFVRPSPQALNAIRKVIQVARTTTSTQNDLSRSASPPAALEYGKIIYGCWQVYEKSLVKLFRDLFKAAYKDFFKRSERADSNVAEQHYLEVAQQFQATHEKLASVAQEHASKIFNNFWASGDQNDSLDDNDKLGTHSELSLVDSEKFEEWLSIADIAQKGENDFQQELYQIQKRLTLLAPDKVITHKNNPMGPMALTQVFSDTLDPLELKQFEKLLSYKLFEQHVMNQAGWLYDEVNGYLECSGLKVQHDRPPTPKPANRPAKTTNANLASVAPKPTPPAIIRPTKKKDVPAGPAKLPVQASPKPPAPVQVPRPHHYTDVFNSLKNLEGVVQSLHAKLLAPSNIAAPLAPASQAPLAPASQAPLASASQAPLAPAPQAPLASASQAPLAPAPQAPLVAAPQTPLVAARQVSSTSAPPIYGVGEVVSLLSQIQQHISPQDYIALSPEARHTQVVQQVQKNLISSQAESQKKALDTSQQDVANNILVLFEYILADPSLPEPLKVLIGRLEIPVLKLAMLDSSFFHNKKHPARRLLNVMAQAGTGWTERDGRQDKWLIRMQMLVERLLREFKEDPNSFIVIAKSFLAQWDQEQKGVEANEVRLQHANKGRDRLEEARYLANRELQLRCKQAPLPLAIQGPEFFHAWKDVLVLSSLKHGVDSPQWQTALQLLDQLVAPFGLASTDTELPTTQINQLLVEVEEQLVSISWDSQKIESIIKALRISLRAKAQGETLQTTDSTPPKKALAEQEDLYTDQAKRLQVDNWIEFYDDQKKKIRAKLAWKGKYHSSFVLVNRKGVKIKELDLHGMAALLRKSSTKLLDDVHMPLVERALYAKMDKMATQLAFQAKHDDLTGLTNRAEFEYRLAIALEKVKKKGSDYALCYYDLDQFKLVNDSCGHQAGDNLIKNVAEVLQEFVSDQDVLARLGGDEFGILLKNCNLEMALGYIEEHQEAIKRIQFECRGHAFQITFSVGLVPLSSDLSSVSQLFSTANNACYAAKEAGRNRVHVLKDNKEVNARQEKEMEWLTRIDDALAKDRFQLRCQPIAHIQPKKEQEGHHFEILIRMLDDSGQVVPPDEFIPTAEKHNRMREVDRWVVRNVFQWLHEHPKYLPKLAKFAINLSGQSVGQSDFKEFILDTLRETAVPVEKICFEVTESAAMEHLDKSIHFIEELREVGFRFSLDDFGTGLSSFAYLKNLPLDYLKIDGAFVKNLETDLKDYAFVKSINEIGHFMGMQVIAEYVENDQILEKLREIGVDFAQGYGIGKPKPIENLASL